MWKPQEVIDFASDCIEHGVKAVSLGGGEPFEYNGVFEVIDALYPKCYLSVTSNGLPLEDEKIWEMRMMLKQKFIRFVKRDFKENWLKNQGDPTRITSIVDKINPDALLIECL